MHDDDPADTPPLPPAELTIDYNGDLLLIIGAQQVPMLVSSKHPALVSEVFAAMLADRFKEGNEFAKHDV